MAPKLPIFLDHHSTTPCDPRVVEVMAPTFSEQFGNASSRQHSFGWQAEALVDRAREQVAALIGANPTEIVFTSGATESDNLAIKGVARAYASKGKHIITDRIEHKAVLDTCLRLESEGFRVTLLPVDREGLVRAEDVEAAIGDDTTLVSIMVANNEIGSINPIAEIGAICKRRGVIFHSDGAQALAILDCNVDAMGLDLLSISAHKMYGPKGVGALYVRRRNPRVRLEPLIDGGGHERQMRSGTLNVPGIVGLGKACEIAAEVRDQDAKRISRLRDRLQAAIFGAFPDTLLNGPRSGRLANNLNVSFPGIDSDSLIVEMKDVAVSSGSACTSASPEPSHVLRALGLSEELSHSSIRFGLGRSTTAEEIDYATEKVIASVRRLRSEAVAKG